VATKVLKQVSRTLELLRGLRLTTGSSEEPKQTVIATQSGILRYTPPNKYWVESTQKRYIPKVKICDSEVMEPSTRWVYMCVFVCVFVDRFFVVFAQNRQAIM
jgi:hypothetical protein